MRELTSRRDWLSVTVVLVLAALPTAVATAGEARVAPAAKYELVAQCPGGRLYRCGDRRVLALAGTPYQMGLAQGTLLKAEVRSLLGDVLTFVRAADGVKAKDYFAGSIEKAYARLEKHIPPRYQAEMRGLADGAGASVRDVQLANVFPALFHCSGFALAGKATKDGRLLHGRILDYLTVLGLQARAVTVIARPRGRHAFVNVSYAGFLGSVTGMNERQVAIGEMGGGGEGQWDGVPMPMLVRRALEDCGTLDEALTCFRTAPRTCEYYYVVSDGKTGAARGLYCTPKTFQAIKPGQKDPRLPVVLPDCVIFSGPDRLVALAGRVKQQYGKITPRTALEMMTRPVSMKDNLHNVLFAPASGELWVAHADKDVSNEKFQACYQPYRHYDMAELLALLPPEPAGAPAEPPARHAAAPTTRPAEPVETFGRVPVTLYRPMAPAGDKAAASLLAPYQPKLEGFAWGTRLVHTSGSQRVRTVAFPSPVHTAVECNNTVHGEYFLAADDGAPTALPVRRPAVIVLHILDGRFLVARAVSSRLAAAGINALLVKLPYYGPRRPADKAKLEKSMKDDPQVLFEGIRQGIMDVRRAARWLSARPEVDPARIGICGVSLGGFVAAAAAGVDGHFPRVAVILAGGDLVGVLDNPSREVREIRKTIREKGWDTPRLQKLLHPIDPLTYAPRLRRSHVLMVNAKKDGVVPAACAQKLADASGAEIHWYPTDHTGMVLYLPAVLTRVLAHFMAKDWRLRKAP